MNLKRLSSILLVACAAAASRSVHAGVVNGGFETSSLTGWTKLGDVKARSSFFGMPPPEGTWGALLSTGRVPQPSDRTLETLLGLPVGALDGTVYGDAHSGCAMTQLVQVAAGDALSFQYDVASQAAGANDFAFVSFGDELVVLATRDDAVTPIPGWTFAHTGVSTYEHVFEQDGTFLLGFGVVDIGGNTYPTVLYLDRVAIVPEPATLVMLGAGLLTLAGARPMRRR